MVERKKGKRSRLELALLVMGILLVLLLAEVLFLARKKVKGDIKLTCVAAYPYKSHRDMAIDADGTIYILNDQGVTKMVDGKEVKNWPLDFSGKFASSIVSTEKSLLVAFGGVDFLYKIDKQSGKVSRLRVGNYKGMVGLAADEDDVVYVTEAEKSLVIVMREDGKIIRTFGGTGAKLPLLCPTKLAYYDGHLYIMDPEQKMVHKYSTDGKYKDSWEDFWATSGVADIAADGKGQFYVNDHFADKIWVFDTKGKLTGAVTGETRGTFHISAPGGIAGGKDGHIYICSHMIGKFRPIGN